MGYVVEVEVRPCEDPVKGQGVYAKQFISQGTVVWTPTLLEAWTPEEAKQKLSEMQPEAAHVFLRHCFVAPTVPDRLQLNPTDDGRYTNHSSSPNTQACEDPSQGTVATRDIAAGEELTCDYRVFANPGWYKEICELYGVLPTDEVARKYS
mmetsp:Transcript_17392/g.37560  ORF Transcript_17392/g.37560 Transcript_17392/m.37560 type:complete len:151 (-) Transcript_17392:243-695(-)|eukprot:CAMPEP_0202923434 /NCGR_PEP_ID=MMETSP1392-20130828/78447_1 /ASSEMBLY_ACC=CAM_ASM_000868 /TAXON_ID=225041 /ORGANISM="Chlamydomonas chlamydogama, Strain SAG 11-48b" /LENGTH=150 /DNA_ID=CAMNT_0049617113 /DNA_START=46 /DNA_END=498 /DNA_ORIENTATION=+